MKMLQLLAFIALLLLATIIGFAGAFIAAANQQNFGLFCLGSIMLPIAALLFGQAKQLLDRIRR